MTPDGGLEIRSSAFARPGLRNHARSKRLRNSSASIPHKVRVRARRYPALRPTRLAPGGRARWSWPGGEAGWLTRPATCRDRGRRRESRRCFSFDPAMVPSRRSPGVGPTAHRAFRNRTHLVQPQTLTVRRFAARVDPVGLEVDHGSQAAARTSSVQRSAHAAHAVPVSVEPEWQCRDPRLCHHVDDGVVSGSIR